MFCEVLAHLIAVLKSRSRRRTNSCDLINWIKLEYEMVTAKEQKHTYNNCWHQTRMHTLFARLSLTQNFNSQTNCSGRSPVTNAFKNENHEMLFPPRPISAALPRLTSPYDRILWHLTYYKMILIHSYWTVSVDRNKTTNKIIISNQKERTGSIERMGGRTGSRKRILAHSHKCNNNLRARTSHRQEAITKLIAKIKPVTNTDHYEVWLCTRLHSVFRVQC